VAFIMISRFLYWLIGAHHTLQPRAEFNQFGIMTGISMLSALFLFSVYLAVEPFVRRHTPELLIGWARVLQGRPTDPRAGRDALVGALFGVLLWLVTALVNAIPAWAPFPRQTPIPPSMSSLLGGRQFVADLLGLPSEILLGSFTFFGVWFLLRLLLRRHVLAGIALALLITVLSLGRENPVVEVPGALLTGILMAWMITRYGLLALMVSSLMAALLRTMPVPVNLDAPYAAQSIIVLLVVAALAVAAFRVSLGNRSAFSAGAAE
jgi:hypothetical protein